VIDFDDLDGQSVGPAVALGERRRSSAHHGAIRRDGAGPAAFVGPSGQFDSRMVVISQIKILSPMIIFASARVPPPGCYAKHPAGYRQICLDSSIVGPRAGSGGSLRVLPLPASRHPAWRIGRARAYARCVG
jgi:hypothetical protein